jgi:hypothetical protein
VFVLRIACCCSRNISTAVLQEIFCQRHRLRILDQAKRNLRRHSTQLWQTASECCDTDWKISNKGKRSFRTPWDTVLANWRRTSRCQQKTANTAEISLGIY